MRHVTKHELNRILSSSVSAKTFVNITRKTSKGWQLLKSKLHEVVDQLVTITDPVTIYGIKEQPHGEVAIGFRHKRSRMIFTTNCEQNTFVWPNTMVEVGRRIYDRYEPRESVMVRFWDTTRDIYCEELINISGGGLGLKSTRPYPEGQYMCSVITKPSITIESLLKKCEPSDKGFTLNFQFLGIDLNPMKHLTRIQAIQHKFMQK